ncbi:putative nucleic acid-binding protein [Lupinus albus]|uniref:Putative nucleic acid-binding protein n=1 Tax=Lupinus albus TaxID=3870 RepID=A0A6A4PDP0_LUPAL|nr:putative nucleic acid-binding protein [Lupinus albus]
MARRVNFIEEINATKDTWKIKVRIVGLWRVDRSSAPSLEMIFMDENGDKIEAVVKNYHISLWETKIQEGQSYVGENFDVVTNEGQYRCCKHPFKLIFQKGTIMTNKQLSDIPLYIYQFTAFEDILSGVATTNVLIDVIGEFIDIEMSQPESMPKKVVFGMRDQRGNNISCTLWGQFASQLLKYERDHKFGPIVVILTLAKIREAKGNIIFSFSS